MERTFSCPKNPKAPKSIGTGGRHLDPPPLTVECGSTVRGGGWGVAARVLPSSRALAATTDRVALVERDVNKVLR